MAVSAQQPVDEPVASGFTQAVGVHPQANGLVYVVERRGTVQVLENGTRLATPLLDIRDEVGNWRDFGMLGFALDPGFAGNGHFYVAYVVDRHHLRFAGTPAYDPLADEYFAPTIVRVTRYTADPASGGRRALPASRQVLLGETAATGAPLTYTSHGACALAFGRDGTLLVGIGDGASHVGVDAGSAPETWWQQALTDGILTTATNVGAFRAQQVDSLSGKLLRLDPATGDGVPGNPFFDQASPRSARSRVFALGLRNPCRLTVRPGTGSPDRTLGRPGSIYIGDVGHTSYEELHVVSRPGQNCGWPLYQGLGPDPAYGAASVDNRFAANPLAGGGCTPWFRFHDLLRQPRSDHAESFLNPCNPAIPIPPATPTFVHSLPVLDWRHGVAQARVPVFVGVNPDFVPVGAPGSGVTGTPFEGNASIAGTWHSGVGMPAGHGSCYFHADFGGNWLRRLRLDPDDRLLEVHEFATITSPVALAEHPGDHSLWYVSYSLQQVRRLRFILEPPPTAIPTASVQYGPSTLEVQFDARASSDPAGQPLRFEWDLGAGRRTTWPQFSHKFTGTGSPTTVPVTLTAIDSAGARNSATIPIVLDNTPPRIRLAAASSGGLYSLAGPTTVPLQAGVTDREHTANQLTWAWRTTLLHGNHRHDEPVDSRPTTSTTFSPTPRDGEFYAWLVTLTVTDAGGLSDTATAWWFPDTAGASTAVVLTGPTAGDRFDSGQPIELTTLGSGPVQRVDWYGNGRLVASSTTPPFAASWTPEEPGSHAITAIAIGADGTSSGSRGSTISVTAPRLSLTRLGQADADGAQPQQAGGIMDLGNRVLSLGADAGPTLTGLRFDGIAVPAGARLLGAHVEFTAAADDTDPATLQVAIETTAAPAAMRPGTDDLRRRNLGSAVTWQPGPWTRLRSGAEQRTPDLVSLLQPLVASAKWHGTALLALTGTGRRRAFAWDGNAPVAALLTLTWLPPAPTPQVLAVTTGPDDAAEGLATGIATNLAATLPLGRSATEAQLIGLRWSLPVPRGARIRQARVRFVAAAADASLAAFALQSQVSDDALPFVNTRYGLALRPRSPTAVAWTPAPWNPGDSGPAQTTADVATLLQERVDSPGWQPGNGVVLLLRATTGSRPARSFDGGAAPVLLLEYEPPGK